VAVLPPRSFAVLQALLVTFLWSTSWVLIKVGLEDLPPLTFAGLRYGLAALVLLPLAVRGGLRGDGCSSLSWASCSTPSPRAHSSSACASCRR